MNNLNTLASQGKINENANVKDRHSIIINAPIDKVWSILSDMEKWPEWHDKIKKVQIEGEVARGTDFSWTFDGKKFNSQIQSADAPTQLSWTGKTSMAKSVHVWQLEDDENQTIASLGTSLQGTFTILFNKHQKIYNDLLTWLQMLKEASEK
ncbi:MAG: SRPBCC family protein [Cyclobacteriaceae bacterium]